MAADGDCDTIAGAWNTCAATSGAFDGHPLAVATAGACLRLWRVQDSRVGQLCCEAPCDGAVLCLHAVPVVGSAADMLFVLYCDLRWQLVGFERVGGGGRRLRLEQRMSGALSPPEQGAETLFRRGSVQCCVLPTKGTGSAVLLSVWDRWLTVLQFAHASSQYDLPILSGGDALPVSGAPPPRVVQLSTWATDATACGTVCDPMGNPAVAVIYADDSLRVLHVACVNIDLTAAAVLPGPWSLQNIGIAELEQECALVPICLSAMQSPRANSLLSGMLVIGQGARATYLSGDGEVSATTALPSDGMAAATAWTGCQLPFDDTAAKTGAEASLAVTVLLCAKDNRPNLQLLSLSIGPSERVEITSSPLATDCASGCDILLPGGPGLIFALSRSGECCQSVAAIKGTGVQQVDMTQVQASGAPTEVHSVAVAASDFLPLSRSGSDKVHACGTGVEGSIVRAVKATCATARGQLQLGRLAGELEMAPEMSPTAERTQLAHGATGLFVLRSTRTGEGGDRSTMLVLTSHVGIQCGTRAFLLTQSSSPSCRGWSIDEPDLDGDFGTLGDLAHLVERSSPTLAAAFVPLSNETGQSGFSGEMLVQVTQGVVKVLTTTDHENSMPRVWEWRPSAGSESSSNDAQVSMEIGAAAIDSPGMRLVVSVGRTIFSHCLQCSSSGDGFSASEAWEGCGGEVSALALDSGVGPRLLAYAVWHSNELGVVDAATLARTHCLPRVNGEGGTLPDSCHSVCFMRSATGKQCWLLAGLAGGNLQCYRMCDPSVTNEIGVLHLCMTVAVGIEPVQLTAFDGANAPSPPFVYASSSRDLLILPPEVPEQRLRVIAVAAPHLTLCLASVRKREDYRYCAIWVDRPQPGCGLSRLRVGTILPQSALRWRTCELPLGQEPTLLLADAATQSLLLVTEGAQDATAPSPSGQQPLQCSRVQTVHLFDGSSLDQLGSMVLEVGHVVTALSAAPPQLNESPLQPRATSRATAVNFLVGSTLTRNTVQYSDTVPASCQTFLSVLHASLKRENEDSQLTGSLALLVQSSVGVGPARAISAICPFVDRDGDPACAVAHGGGGSDKATTTISIYGFHTHINRSDHCDSATNGSGEGSNNLALKLITAKILVDCSVVPSSLCALLPSLDGQRGLTAAAAAAAAAACDDCGALLLASGVRGQSLLRWHTDPSRPAHLLVVAKDQVEPCDSNQRGRAAAGALLLHSPDAGNKVCIVLSPLVGGLRVLSHNRASELEPVEDDRREMQLLPDEAEGETEDRVAVQPDVNQNQPSSVDATLLDKPCPLVQEVEFPSVGWATSPAIRIHTGLLGVAPHYSDNYAEDQVDALIVCRVDGTVHRYLLADVMVQDVAPHK